MGLEAASRGQDPGFRDLQRSVYGPRIGLEFRILVTEELGARNVFLFSLRDDTVLAVLTCNSKSSLYL